jgi:hypothetical protein
MPEKHPDTVLPGNGLSREVVLAQCRGKMREIIFGKTI